MRSLSYKRWSQAFFLLIFIYLAACGGQVQPTAMPTEVEVFPTFTSIRMPPKKRIDSAAPRVLREQVEAIPLADGEELALAIVSPSDSLQPNETRIPWVYALVAPFPTVRDGVTSDELRAAWNGSLFNGKPLLMAESTFGAMKAIWGESASGSVRSVEEDQLLRVAWNESAYAIIPFESLSPRWKVLAIDGQAPIRKGFDVAGYPLVVSFALHSSGMIDPVPTGNYDASKLTTVVLTGVTALVRATAFKMEQKGIEYPGEEIRDLMREADIAHVSNEIAFFSKCPPPNPNSGRLVFCSDPKYIGLFTDIGVDVVELTGNHFADYGRAAMDETLEIYTSNNIAYFGGGADLEDAFQPALFEVNGNKLAFLGCNRPDIGGPKVASDSHSGAAPCDFDYFTAKIAELKAQGYLVIFTFQWYEDYAAAPNPQQVEDFHRVAEAGAVIVSGSQAHFPKAMEFLNDSFIHYGLGNLFFDQMGNFDWMPEGIRREFIDRYAIYDGRLIGVELITTMLEDFSRPRFMTDSERTEFLQEYFIASNWISVPAGTSVP